MFQSDQIRAQQVRKVTLISILDLSEPGTASSKTGVDLASVWQMHHIGAASPILPGLSVGAEIQPRVAQAKTSQGQRRDHQSQGDLSDVRQLAMVIEDPQLPGAHAQGFTLFVPAVAEKADDFGKQGELKSWASDNVSAQGDPKKAGEKEQGNDQQAVVEHGAQPTP